ncbi:hypothetical protein Hypma_006380 [Hypsizygus marmoreus]|uniref:Protein kinase domain-containing protein n=1 Tax=Hypsizygus marmoreus TaxID=39966 RepID=A0A369JW29_HYPMA|nr:hypothetical protein Hypma_006380 [Hypsizygus marmoreus]
MLPSNRDITPLGNAVHLGPIIITMANPASAVPSEPSTQTDENCTVASETALLAFSSMTIYGLVFSKGKQVPFVLHRSISFPSRRVTGLDVEVCDNMEGWDSMPLPVGKPHLELKLGKRLGDGRIGFAYVARVIAVLDQLGGVPIANPPLELSTELVLKFVRPTNCRSLARESWFYERLSEAEGYQGAVVPLCYGFFNASTTSMQPPLPAPLKVKPWIDKHGKDVPMDFPEGQRKYGDELPDEYTFNEYRDDGRTCRTDSPWCEWRPDPKNPLLAVLVLEKLGEAYSEKVFDTDRNSRKDVVDLLDDLFSANVRHGDYKFNNVVRSHTNIVCPRHGYAHQWRVIDFDQAERWAATEDDEFFPRIDKRLYIRNNYKEFPVTFWMSLAGY